MSWEAEWQPVIDQIGETIGAWRWASSDVIEPAMIRRYCEVLEFDCPLYHDEEVARAHGHDGLIAPATAAVPFSLPPVWNPGEEPAFPDASRDAQPRFSVIVGIDVPNAPKTTGFFATDIEADYIRPAKVGERLHQTALKLLACSPKETKVGRGAFMTFENEMRTVDDDDLIALNRISTFSYNPVSS